MSEATKRALHDAYASSHSRNWVEIFCAIDAHVKDEIAASRAEAESKPEPSETLRRLAENVEFVFSDALAQKDGAREVVEYVRATVDNWTATPAAESSAEGSTEAGVPCPWDKITLFTVDGDAWDFCKPGHALLVPFLAAYEFVSADVAEKRVGACRDEDLRRSLRDVLAQTQDEGVIAAARRVVAERDAWKESSDNKARMHVEASQRAEATERERAECKARLDAAYLAIAGAKP